MNQLSPTNDTAICPRRTVACIQNVNLPSRCVQRNNANADLANLGSRIDVQVIAPSTDKMFSRHFLQQKKKLAYNSIFMRRL